MGDCHDEGWEEVFREEEVFRKNVGEAREECSEGGWEVGHDVWR